MDDPDYEWLMLDASTWPIPTGRGPGRQPSHCPTSSKLQAVDSTECR